MASDGATRDQGFEELPHGGAAADDVPEIKARVQPLLQVEIFFFKPAVIQGFEHQDFQFIDVDGLGEVVVGPGLEGLHGRAHRSVSGHDDHRGDRD